MARRRGPVSRRFVCGAALVGGGALLVAGRCQAAPVAQRRLQIFNDSSTAWYLWICPERGKQWLKPQFLPRRQRVPVELDREGLFYIVLRDESKRAIHVGWRDLRAAAERLATPPDGVAELSLSVAVVNEERTSTYAVQVPVTETVTKIVEVDGVKRTVEEQVTRMIPEERTRTIVVKTSRPVLSGRVAGKQVSFDEPVGELPDPPELPEEHETKFRPVPALE